MKLSLYQKIAISALVTFILVLGSFVFISQSLESISRDQAEQELHQELAAHLVHDNPLLASGEHPQVALENLFHSMMILGPNFEFYVLDKKGKILTYSAKPGEVIRNSVDIEPIQAVIDGNHSFPIYADDPRSSQQKVFSTAPIIKNNEVNGYLFVIIGGKLYDGIFTNIKNNKRIQLIAGLAFATLIFLLVILLISFRFFVNPLKQLRQEIGAINLNVFQQKLQLLEVSDNGVEVNELSTAFNQLINQVNLQIEKLSAVDNERRELLAHLSHDLRTPLASLMGFLETIKLKHQQLSTEDKLQYVERCLKNANSVKGFVDQIFELAHLESGQVTVSLEEFPIADLLYDTVDKFSISAGAKKIEMKVECQTEIELNHLTVSTDIAKLERILTNLIENAIRHTPEHGSISLIASLQKQNQQISLKVKDSGSGVVREELPYLFEPRYRGKQALEDGDRHIGLGLTITRKLVALLGGVIKAGNNPEGGAYFEFELSLHN